MSTELKKFYDRIDDIEIAMMTTRRPDGHLESRAMANQKRRGGADLWFVTTEGTAKLRDIAADQDALLGAGVSRVYTPQDFEVSRIMGDIVDLVAEHHGVAVASA